MKQTRSNRIFIGLFLGLCLLPVLGLLLFGESGAVAKEVRAEAPRLRDPEGRLNADVLNEASDWLGDRFFLRREMLSAWSWTQGLLGSSAEEQVVCGRDGWLYFSETLEDYAGPRLSDARLERIAARLARLQAECEARGAQFLFTVAPNKNSLYPEHMPRRFPSGHEESDLVRLRPLLEQYGVRYVDLFSLELPYYRTDTHWTAEGAARAADALLAAFGRERSYAAGPFAAEGTHRGDLYDMLFPAFPASEEETVWRGNMSYVCENDPRGGDAIRIQTRCPDGQGSLFCWRDSFGAALYPFLAQDFESAVFSRKTDWVLPEGDYEFALLEIVERNLGDLAD